VSELTNLSLISTNRPRFQDVLQVCVHHTIEMGITRAWSRLDERTRKPVASSWSDNIKSPMWHTYYCMTAGCEAACECRSRWHVSQRCAGYDLHDSIMRVYRGWGGGEGDSPPRFFGSAFRGVHPGALSINRSYVYEGEKRGYRLTGEPHVARVVPELPGAAAGRNPRHEFPRIIDALTLTLFREIERGRLSERLPSACQ